MEGGGSSSTLTHVRLVSFPKDSGMLPDIRFPRKSMALRRDRVRKDDTQDESTETEVAAVACMPQPTAQAIVGGGGEGCKAEHARGHATHCKLVSGATHSELESRERLGGEKGTTQ